MCVHICVCMCVCMSVSARLSVWVVSGFPLVITNEI